MADMTAYERVAHLVDQDSVEIIDVLGPTVEFLTRPEADDSSPCVMRGTIPPGVSIPLHSHADPETFLELSGEIEGLAYLGEDFKWIRIRPGDIFHVPSGARHAFRNQTQASAVMIFTSTSKIGRFFREIGTPVEHGSAVEKLRLSAWKRYFREIGRPMTEEAEPPQLPTEEMIRHFLETAERYGYWNATPEENARVGISLPSM
jgi:quercetin dioxygenase-like cupin family protein